MCKYIIGGIIGVGFIFLSCSPPEEVEFWTGTEEDSVKVMKLLEEVASFNDPTLFAEKSLIPLDSAGYEFMKKHIPAGDTFRPRYLIRAFWHEVKTIWHKDTIIWVKDTTIQVQIYDTIQITLHLQADSVMKKGERVFTPIDTVISKTVKGRVWQEVFIDSQKVGDWAIKKITGGWEVHTPTIDDAPVIFWITYEIKGDEDTIRWLPDTLQYGVHRLYSVDSLITLNVGDTFIVRSIRSLSPMDTLVCFVYAEGKRYSFVGSDLPIVFNNPGRKRIYFAAIKKQSFIYKDEKWLSNIWGIPIVVK